MEMQSPYVAKIVPEAAASAPHTTQATRRAVLSSTMAASTAVVLAPFAGATAQAAVAGLRVDPSDETIRLGPLAVRFLLTGDDSTGSVAAFELAVPAAQHLAAPAHSHDHYEETVYGIAGVLTWTVDGTPIDVGSGQALCIPRGAIHRFDNNGSQDVKALCLVTPDALGPQYFREAAEVMNAAAGGPPDRARMAEIMRRHGLTPLPPPPQT